MVIDSAALERIAWQGLPPLGRVSAWGWASGAYRALVEYGNGFYDSLVRQCGEMKQTAVARYVLGRGSEPHDFALS